MEKVYEYDWEEYSVRSPAVWSVQKKDLPQGMLSLDASLSGNL